jgi:predicted small metal-binding protein
MSDPSELTYVCLEPGCGWKCEAHSERELVERVQAHMADEHDTFELEDVIIDNARAVTEAGTKA